MKLEKKGKTVVLVPYPALGHVTPMLQLASSLHHNFGLRPVMVLPEFLYRRLRQTMNLEDGNTEGMIQWVGLQDGLDEVETGGASDFFAIEEAMEKRMPMHLDGLIKRMVSGGVACVIIDLLASWAIDVAQNQCRVPTAGFWPAMLSTYSVITSIPDMLTKRLISSTGLPQYQGPILFQQDEPLLHIKHLPWLIGSSAARELRFKFWARILERSKSLPWLLVNSHPDDKVKSIRRPNTSHQGPVIYPIGPLGAHEKLRPTLNFKEEDLSCFGWLDRQRPESVVYISFGSWVSPIGATEVRSLALALEASGIPFIWALGPGWRDGLPVGFTDRVSKQGRIIAWAPQVDILQHDAVGCFLTHCGWNSTLEAIRCRKCILCYPIAGDQFLNCAYIVNTWKIGVNIKGFEVEEVKDGIKKIMEDVEMKTRMATVNEMIMGKEARSKRMTKLSSFINDITKFTPLDYPFMPSADIFPTIDSW
ncbi:hypothetical protein Ancab_029910 [Ancistrocladus abbreviatus]